MSRAVVAGLLLLLPFAVAAKCGGGGGGGSGTPKTYYIATDGNNANPGTLAAPWRTFAHAGAASRLKPGDTVLIRAGTYNETIRPLTSGTAAKRITWAAYPGAEVVITNPPVSTDTERYCINLPQNTRYVTFDGLVCDGQTLAPNASLDFGVAMPRVDHVVIQNSTFHYINNRGVNIFVNSSFNRVLDNHFEYIGNTQGSEAFVGRSINIAQGAHHNLVEGNTANFAGHNHVLIEGATYNIVRNNSFRNHWWRIAAITGNPDTGALATNNVIEANEFFETDKLPAVLLTPPSAIEMRAPRNLFRRNLFVDNITYGITMAAQTGAPGKFSDLDLRDNRIYHNVFFQNGQGGWQLTHENAPTAQVDGNVLVNNVFQLNGNGFVDTHIQLDMDLDANGCNPPALCLGGTLFWNNVFRGQFSGDAQIKANGLPQAPLATYQANYPANFVANADALPRFVDSNPTGGYDFHLQSTSTLRDTGVFLTHTTAPGYGSAIPVEDASWFIDGYGLVAGDRIEIEGSNQVVMVCAVDTAQNLLMVDTFLPMWGAGKGVSFAYEGAAPDIGVFEYGAAEPGPEPEPCTPASGGSGCGLGFELTLLLPALAALRRRRD